MSKIFFEINSFGPKHFLDPKIFFSQNFSESNIFSIQHFFEPKIFLAKIFWTQRFFGHLICLGPKFLDTKLKYFSTLIFLDPLFVWTTKVFGINNLLGPTIFWHKRASKRELPDCLGQLGGRVHSNVPPEILHDTSLLSD